MGRVVSVEDLASAVAAERAAGKRIVLTNGCFDVLHVGHVRVLQRCRTLGDLLVVGVNSDDSARRLKGAERPFVPEVERAELLAALAAVDYVVVFPEATAERLAAVVRPDVYVKGADYARHPAAPGGGEIDAASLPEAAVVQAAGGRVVLLPLTPDHSTTGLIQRIRASTRADDIPGARAPRPRNPRPGT
ncbi:MAG: adenylyltransferase/cytidyltransferase family protein, partial [Chloroflexota bacterium]